MLIGEMLENEKRYKSNQITDKLASKMNHSVFWNSSFNLLSVCVCVCVCIKWVWVAWCVYFLTNVDSTLFNTCFFVLFCFVFNRTLVGSTSFITLLLSRNETNSRGVTREGLS
jgi:hypothetical protein